MTTNIIKAVRKYKKMFVMGWNYNCLYADAEIIAIIFNPLNKFDQAITMNEISKQIMFNSGL